MIEMQKSLNRHCRFVMISDLKKTLCDDRVFHIIIEQGRYGLTSKFRYPFTGAWRSQACLFFSKSSELFE